MFRSIRWTLQLWHAGILVAAVTGIGVAGYLQISTSRYRAIDSELDAAAQALVAEIRPVPSRGFHEMHRPMHPMSPGGDPLGLDDGIGPGRGPGPSIGGRARFGPRSGGGQGGTDIGPGFDGPGDLPGTDAPADDQLPAKMETPTEVLSRYHGTDAEGRSFVVWQGERIVANWGKPVSWSDLPMAPLLPESTHSVLRQLEGYHEVVAAGPAHSFVIVRSSIAPVQDELHHLVSTLAITAGAILLFGFTGGWLVSLRAVRPIRRMTKTAESFSAADLSGRIDISTVPSELRTLTRVLNGTFARLESSFARQVRFTADASHELRTPLAVVHSNAELALSRERTAEEYRKTIETCFAAAKRMRNLTDSLLLLAHADAGELAMEVEPFDLSEVILDGVDLLDAAAVAAGVTVTTHIRPLVAVGDPVRMGQVVVNLVGNAIRYNKPDGTVTVRTEQIPEQILLIISDTGVGISAEDLPMVFDRFFRADKARTRKVGGSGLGTAICKSIVEAHGGTISVESRIDVGTTFTVRLPKALGNELDEAPEPEPEIKLLPHKPASSDRHRQGSL
jgi:two-component system OmpR family sensor kinase